MRTCSWLPRLTTIIREVGQCPLGPLNRTDIERLFDVGPARAVQLLHQFGATQHPDGLYIDRERLAAHLEALAVGLSGTERDRVIAEKITRYQPYRAAPFANFPIQVGPNSHSSIAASLPASIRFEPGRLVIEHEGIEDLLAKLFLLAQAAINDEEGLKARTSCGDAVTPGAAADSGYLSGDQVPQQISPTTEEMRGLVPDFSKGSR